MMEEQTNSDELTSGDPQNIIYNLYAKSTIIVMHGSIILSLLNGVFLVNLIGTLIAGSEHM